MLKKSTKFLFILILLIVPFIFSSCEVNVIKDVNVESSEILLNENGIKNIILIIGDGMGYEHITSGELYENKVYNFTNWDKVNVNTDSINSSGVGPVKTDSAAAATALATGNLTVNGYVGKNHLKEDVETILDVASACGKATGIVTTDKLYGATPSGFSAHSSDRNDKHTIIQTQILSNVNLLCGAYSSTCSSYKTEIRNAGYIYTSSFSKVDSTMTSDKAYWNIGLGDANAEVELKDATKKAITFLSKDEDGFVLMIEQAHIDKYSHNNDFEGMVKSVKSLNDTVDTVLKWIGNRTDTAVLITSDHETGGLTVSNNPVYSNTFVLNNSQIYYNFSSTSHTNSKVGLFVYNLKVNYSKFNYYSSNHLVKNTDVFNLMKEILNKNEVVI